MNRIALLTPDPGYEENWQPVADRYAALLGASLVPHVWHDVSGLDGFDLILPLMAWGYQREPERWFACLDRWERSGLPLVNPATALRWNSRKTYLLGLEQAGIAIVPTIVTDDVEAALSDEARARFGSKILVIKPAISGGADSTYRLAPGDAVPVDACHREMLIQPLIPSIASEGEYSLFFFDGTFSHAIRKIPQAGDFRVQEQFGGREITYDPPAAMITCARQILAVAPQSLAYARVDLVLAEDGAFLLMELELIEPSLFLDHSPDGGAAFVRAIQSRLS